MNFASENNRASLLVETDKFTIYREFIFKDRTFIKESLKISFENTIFENREASEFLQEKFPTQILDFIFFDGEVEKNLSIFDKNSIQKILEKTFDLDILISANRDCRTVKNRFLKEIDLNELENFKNLNLNKDRISENILNLSEQIIDLEFQEKQNLRKLKRIEKVIENDNFEIFNINRDLNKFKENQEYNISEFKKINMFSFPMIINSELSQKVSENSKFLQIDNKNIFEDRFSEFYNLIQSNFSKNELLSQFYKIFGDSILNIEIDTSKDDLINLFSKISENSKNSKILESKKQLFLEDNLSDDSQNLQLELENINQDLDNISSKLTKLQNKLLENELELKEVEAKLRIEFVQHRSKFSTIKTIEELEKIEKLSLSIFENHKSKSLEKFNSKFQKNLKPFIQKYKNIDEVSINNSFKILANSYPLDILSSGQKQILSFIFVTTILDFYNISETIFVDTPFGRLSNSNQEFAFSLYSKFENIVLLLTSSEVDVISQQNFKFYEIIQNDKGSEIVNKNI